MSDNPRKTQSKAHIERFKHPGTPIFNALITKTGWVPEGLKPSDTPLRAPRKRAVARTRPPVSKALVHVPRDKS